MKVSLNVVNWIIGCIFMAWAVWDYGHFMVWWATVDTFIGLGFLGIALMVEEPENG